MAKKMTKLGDRNYTLISDGIKTLGTYNPKEIFCIFEEQLYMDEADTIYDFLEWVHADVQNRRFGHGNYEQRFKEFLDSKTA